jgi:hypothetical protein
MTPTVQSGYTRLPGRGRSMRYPNKVEGRISKLLIDHPNFVELVKVDEYGLWLERPLYGSLRQYCMEGGYYVSLEERIKWCQDVAQEVIERLLQEGQYYSFSDVSLEDVTVDLQDVIVVLQDVIRKRWDGDF